MNKHELFASLNSGILAERGVAFARNLKKNLPLIKKHGGLHDVAAELRGRHVVVAGAGPTLHGSIGLLADAAQSGDVLIIASDAALYPLWCGGIVPDYVITCETLPTECFRGVDTSGIRLLAFSCSSNYMLRSWRGGISFYNWMLQGDAYSRLWELAGEGLGYVATGSIVTTQAVSIAMGCRVSSLMLLGNDLGFYDSFYSRGTARMESIASRAGRFATPEGESMGMCRRSREYEILRGGRTYYTNAQFLAARLWLEELFGREPFPVADCSLPGCSPSIVYKTGLEEYLNSIRNREAL